jgi:hypothetical protein
MVSLTSWRTTAPRPRARRDFSHSTYRTPTTVRHLSRAYNLKSKSKWQYWRWKILGTLILLALLILIYSPLFTIKNIIINNAPSIETEQRIKQIVTNIIQEKKISLFPQSSLLFFNTIDAQNTINKEFYIEGLNFVRHWPNVLRISAPQGVTVAVWYTPASIDNKNEIGESVYLLNKNGALVQQLSPNAVVDNELIAIKETKFAVHQLGEQVVTQKIAEFINNLNNAWRQELPQLTLDYIKFDSSAIPTLQIYTKDQWYVSFSSQEDALLQVVALKRLLDDKIKGDTSKLEYIDVRFGTKLYYKLK